MEIEKSTFKNATFITLKNATGLELTLSDLGASIFQIKLHGKTMTMTLKNKEHFFIVGNYHGKTLGRVGNRVKDATFEIEGKKYFLDKNEGNNSLHGGNSPISNAIFNYLISKGDYETKVIFDYLSPDRESGYPGNFDLRVEFTIYENKNEFMINYEANTDAITPCSITNHTFFTLGEKSVNDLKLRINSSKFLHPSPVDLTAQEIRDITPIMDFRNKKRIGKDIKDGYLQNSKTIGYDHHYYFDEVNPNIANVVLSSDKVTMEIYTDHTGCQVYTDNYPSPYEMVDLPTNVPNRSIALEPQEDHLTLHFLKPNEVYNYFIKYVFKE